MNTHPIIVMTLNELIEMTLKFLCNRRQHSVSSFFDERARTDSELLVFAHTTHLTTSASISSCHDLANLTSAMSCGAKPLIDPSFV